MFSFFQKSFPHTYYLWVGMSHTKEMLMPWTLEAPDSQGSKNCMTMNRSNLIFQQILYTLTYFADWQHAAGSCLLVPQCFRLHYRFSHPVAQFGLCSHLDSFHLCTDHHSCHGCHNNLFLDTLHDVQMQHQMSQNSVCVQSSNLFAEIDWRDIEHATIQVEYEQKLTADRLQKCKRKWTIFYSTMFLKWTNILLTFTPYHYDPPNSLRMACGQTHTINFIYIYTHTHK